MNLDPVANCFRQIYSKLSVESGQTSLGGAPLVADKHNIDTVRHFHQQNAEVVASF